MFTRRVDDTAREQAAQRMTVVLQPVRGWVPPEDVLAAARPTTRALEDYRVEPSTTLQPDPPRVPATSGAHRARTVSRAAVLGTTQPIPLAQPSPPTVTPSTVTPPTATPAVASAPAGPPPTRRRLAALLPASLRTGRLDLTRGAVVGLLVVALLASVIAGVAALRGRPQQVDAPAVLASGQPLPGASVGPDSAGQVVVAVAGKVRRPGLVRLPTGSRVDDAVRASGGPLPGVSLGLLNLARKLVDGEQVLVGVDPPAGATGPGSGPASVGGAAGGLLDLNAATASDLDALPGIGPVLAQRIIDWRTERGRFESVEQLREVTGIGEAKFGDLKAKVRV